MNAFPTWKHIAYKNYKDFNSKKENIAQYIFNQYHSKHTICELGTRVMPCCTTIYHVLKLIHKIAKCIRKYENAIELLLNN